MNVVVDFRGESGEVNAEKKSVEALGMKFVSLPWNGREFLRAINF